MAYAYALAWQLYQIYGSKNSPGVIWGHMSKGNFHQKCSKSFIVRPVAEWETTLTGASHWIYLLLTGAILIFTKNVTGVKRLFSPKMLLLQITCHGNVTHAFALPKYTLMFVTHPRRACVPALVHSTVPYPSIGRGRGCLRLQIELVFVFCFCVFFFYLGFRVAHIPRFL